ncbi:putative RNA-directed DNA polymerase, eukaryota, reverse transcriptase zinc-binding domain protein [Tanacetum coccineum]
MGTKMSKLDRFLLSESVNNAVPNMTVLALDRKWSDHIPILLHSNKVDFGPTPFRLFHSWLEIEEFNDVVVDSYNSFQNAHGSALVNFKNKLKHIKRSCRAWHKDFKEKKKACHKVLCSSIGEVERKIDEKCASQNEVVQRLVWIKELQDMERLEALDVAQKARTKWAVEGDENSAFFHGLLKQRRRTQMVRGVMEAGEWQMDPGSIKNVFIEFYRNKFAAINTRIPSLDRTRFAQLDDQDVVCLESPCSLEEIKNTVWSCGSEKTPGPDGFSFKFVKKYWEVLQHDIFKSVMEFCNHGKLPLGRNASFISLIPKRKKLMVFKVDFEKVYDSLCWEYLDYVMSQFGFGSRWRNWIRECLSSAKLSILINGSRTEEIPMYRGLRQGDPLSHLLFILAMEGLHLSIQKAMEDKRISGVFVGVKKLNISHLFYADDVVFLSRME